MTLPQLSTATSSPESADSLLADVRAFVLTIGTVRDAARLLRLREGTLGSFVRGRPCREGTRALLRERLREVTR